MSILLNRLNNGLNSEKWRNPSIIDNESHHWPYICWL